MEDPERLRRKLTSEDDAVSWVCAMIISNSSVWILLAGIGMETHIGSLTTTVYGFNAYRQNVCQNVPRQRHRQRSGRLQSQPCRLLDLLAEGLHV